MDNYQHYSTNTLLEKKKYLQEDIEDYNRTLSQTKSFIIVLYLTRVIKKSKEKIRAIDAELCYREHNASDK